MANKTYTIEGFEHEGSVEPIYYVLAEKLRDNDGRYVPLLIEAILNVEEAAVAAQAPGTVSEIAEKLKLNPEEVRDQAISGMKKGSIFYNKRNDHI
ncbi:MAG: hypothetical protein E4H16_00325, partial [Candidatus Atribacteria bacterium]